MQNIKTIAGTFTIGTYEIPKQYVCAKTPTITQKNDICEIVTYDQQITVMDITMLRYCIKTVCSRSRLHYIHL